MAAPISDRSPVAAALVVAILGAACGDGGGVDQQPVPVTFGSSSSSSTGVEDDDSSESSEASTSGDDPSSEAEEGSSTSDGLPDCTFCDAPNQACIDDVCVTTCHGQVPDPCGPTEVCDVISGECRAPDASCTLAGDYVECEGSLCGPGSVCDDEGGCIPYPPCADVACLDGACWGTYCSCERSIECEPPAVEDLNGPFSTELSDLAFADDCTAWMVTLRSGADYLRRMTHDGVITVWAGVSNLNMGEVAVLKALTPPPGIAIEPGITTRPEPPAHVEGIGEVALSYICCATCGCAANPPQGVARLDEDAAGSKLPLVIPAMVTSGTGPFGIVGPDTGPFGLTWGVDRVLYIGNSTGNGAFHSADLVAGTQTQLHTFDRRITASAPLTASHLLVALIGGTVYRYNVVDDTAVVVAELGQDVTSLAFDAFDGVVYAGLRNFEVMALRPFTGDVQSFAMMPARGRITVSPNGQLWYAPLGSNPDISAWELPTTF